MDDPPTRQEVQSAIAVSRTTKLLGPTASLLKYSNMMARRCRTGCVRCLLWSGIQVLLISSGRMLMLSASKGRKVTSPRAETAETSLFCPTADKVLAVVMLVRLLQCVGDDVLPEYQCVFRCEISKVDMVFEARQLQEKCCEHHKDQFMVNYRSSKIL